MRVAHLLGRPCRAVCLALVLWAASLPAPGATHYVDATSGSDSNDGLSQASPWRSLSKVSDASLSPGDEVLFKRGEVWNGDTLRVRESGSATQPITIGAYGSGARPVIDSRGEIPGWDDAGNWSQTSGSVWSISLVDDPTRLILSGVEYVEADPEAADPLAMIDDHYRWYHDEIDGKLYVYATQNPAQAYTSMVGLLEWTVLWFTGREHLVLRDLELRGGSTASLVIYGSQEILIQNLVIGFGRAGIRVTVIGSSSTESSKITIEDCTLDSGANLTYDYEYSNVHNGIHFDDGVTYSIIRNSVFRNWGHNAIALVGQEASVPNGVSHNEIYGNLMTAPDISYGRGFGTQGLDGKCEYNRIYRNTIRQTTVRNQINGNNNMIYYNLVDTVTQSPAIPTRGTAQAFQLQAFAGVSHHNSILNNTIVNTEEPAITIVGGIDNADKHDNVIANNLIYNSGLNPDDESLAHCGIFIKDHGSVKNNEFRNNLVFNDSGTHCVHYRDDALTTQAFNARNGNAGDLIESNIDADPQLDTSHGLPAGSPAVGAGVDVGLDSDFLLNPVPAEGQTSPSIGAIEPTDATLPPAPPTGLNLS